VSPMHSSMPFLSNAVVFMGNGTTELRQEGFRSWLSYFCKTPNHWADAIIDSVFMLE
jgi:ABC-type iron transport system FetAB ATPase subunit